MPDIFSIANDGRLIELIESAQDRLVNVFPGLWNPVVEAVLRPVKTAEKAGKKKARKIRRHYRHLRIFAWMYRLTIPKDAQTDVSIILRDEFQRQQYV